MTPAKQFLLYAALICAGALACGDIPAAPDEPRLETYDLASFTPPAGWKREVKKNSSIMYSRIDPNQGWCQLIVYNSFASDGSLDQDFKAEWDAVAAGMLAAAGPRNVADVPAANGWKCRSATGTFTHSGQPGTLKPPQVRPPTLGSEGLISGG